MLKNATKAQQLAGTWCHPDTSAEYNIRVRRTAFNVSAVDTSDGEKMLVSDVQWDGSVLTFITLMPSNKWKVVHRMTPKRGTTLRHEFTCVDTLTKKRGK